MHTADFDYELPAELIAQEPLPTRDQARMMVVHRETGDLQHRRVSDLPEYLAGGDLLVVNNTRVIPARLFGERADTGGNVELLLLEETDSKRSVAGGGQDQEWICMLRAGWKARRGIRLSLAKGRIQGEVLTASEEGVVRVRLQASGPLLAVLETEGVPPVPPYIRRPRTQDEGEDPDLVAMDRDRYQTVYAEMPGAVAAPTAGLHFTPRLLDCLSAKGVGRAALTLHVGPGTFKPVKSERLEDHVMESERYIVSQDAADAVNHARAAGRRIIAVGSTSVRTLESVAQEDGAVKAGSGRSALFIYPPYRFKVVDVLLTNFHLPRSTLVMMVCAFAGKALAMEAYRQAVRERYRFYSYGDCMLIL